MYAIGTQFSPAATASLSRRPKISCGGTAAFLLDELRSGFCGSVRAWVAACLNMIFWRAALLCIFLGFEFRCCACNLQGEGAE
jgi:hypothetical protein